MYNLPGIVTLLVICIITAEIREAVSVSDSKVSTTPAPPECCGPHEVLSNCNNPCFSRTCANANSSKVCPLYCLEENYCDCAEKYRRNSCGKCVPEDECSLPCKNLTITGCFKPNEELSNCYNECTARTCANKFADPNRKCNKLCQLEVCDCKAGYRRNKCGDCVKSDQCDDECNTNESCPGSFEQRVPCYTSCNARTCSNLHLPSNIACKEPCQENRCDCIDGYRRNECNTCVPEDRCDRSCQCSSPCTKPNEVFTCFNGCTERTCENIYLGRLKKCTGFCAPGCDCKDGYRRNRCGKCIPEQKCRIPKEYQIPQS